jgi:hypothetical protein
VTINYDHICVGPKPYNVRPKLDPNMTFSKNIGLLPRRSVNAALLASIFLIPKPLAAGQQGVSDDNVSKRGRAVIERYVDLLEAPIHLENPIGGEQVFAILALNRSEQEIADANRRLAKEIIPFIKEKYWLKTAIDDFRLYWQQTALIKIMLDTRLCSRLTIANRYEIRELIANFFEGFSDEYTRNGLGLSDPSDAAEIHGSDNHDIIRRGFFLLGGQVLTADPQWREHVFAGGYTPSMITEKFGQSLIVALTQRAETGLLAEIGSPTYVGVYLQTLFVMSDHADDPQVRQCVTRYLDLIFADAAQETLGGVRGGARSRAYKTPAAYDAREDTFLLPLFMLTGEPASGPLWPLRANYVPPRDSFAILTTNYRLPKVILDLFYDREAMGSFQYNTRRPSVGLQITAEVRGEQYPVYRPDRKPKYIRSSFVTPKYVLGWFTIDESQPTMAVHDQNEEIGAITATPNSRIAITGTPTSLDRRTSYSDLQAVGISNAFLARQNVHAHSDLPIRLFFSPDFVVTYAQDWLFASNLDGSCFALRAMHVEDGVLSKSMIDPSGWNGEVPGGAIQGKCFDVASKAILIMHAIPHEGRLTDFIDRFVMGVRITPTSSDSGLSYQASNSSILTLYQSKRLPEIDGKPIILPPALTYDSPYLRSCPKPSSVLVRTPDDSSLLIDVS